MSLQCDIFLPSLKFSFVSVSDDEERNTSQTDTLLCIWLKGIWYSCLVTHVYSAVIVSILQQKHVAYSDKEPHIKW
jgi:hypothetical protein